MNPFDFLIRFFFFLFLIVLTIHMFLLGNPGCIFVLPLYFVIKKAFVSDENIFILSVLTFFLFPFAVTGFFVFNLIYFIPNINEYILLILAGGVNFIVFLLAYFCLEFKIINIFEKCLNESEDGELKKKIKIAEETFGKFIDRVRISVDIVRFFCGSISITILGLFIKKINSGNIDRVLHFIGETPRTLGTQSTEIIDYLPFVLYGVFFPSVLGATAVKIFADYLKYKKRPSLFLNND